MKTALITGASSGIGKETAKQLILDGYRVYVAARRVDRMADLEELGATTLAMDITDAQQIEAAVARIEAETEGVDVFINNAGFGMYGAMEDTSIEDVRYQFEVNLFGLGALTQRVLPRMRAKRSGRIVNISSMGGKMYSPLGSWYHATKHALEGWSDCLRLELKSHGIDVIVIEPGAIRTEFGDVMVGPMMERSGDGPYAKMAKSLAKFTEEAWSKDGGSPPTVISRTISKALRARRPKTRYVAGKYAKPMLAVRKWCGDRAFDRLMLSYVK